MSVAKVIEISSESTESFDHAISEGISRASQSIDDICGAWVKDQSMVIQDGQIKEYRVDLKVTFMLHK